jgi:hypothetical protein
MIVGHDDIETVAQQAFVKLLLIDRFHNLGVAKRLPQLAHDQTTVLRIIIDKQDFQRAIFG